MKLIYFLLLIGLVSACSESNDISELPEEPPYFRIEKDSLFFDSEASTQKFYFRAQDGWFAHIDKPDREWCKISPTWSEMGGNHYFEVSVIDNDYSNRQTMIYLGPLIESGKEISIPVFQKQKNTLVLAKNQYKFDNNEHILKLKVESNVDFKTQIDNDWIFQTKNAKSKAVVEKSLVFKIAKNELGMDRKGCITFSGEDQEQKVIVSQGEMVDSIKVFIQHQEQEFSAPHFTGTSFKGIVRWNNDMVTDWTENAAYQYANFEKQMVEIEGVNAESFKIDTLKSISSITIFYERNMNDITEDFENEHKEWD